MCLLFDNGDRDAGGHSMTIGSGLSRPAERAEDLEADAVTTSGALSDGISTSALTSLSVVLWRSSVTLVVEGPSDWFGVVASL